MITIKCITSKKNNKKYIGLFDKYGRLITFDPKVWFPLAQSAYAKAYGVDGWDDVRNLLLDGDKVIVKGEKA